MTVDTGRDLALVTQATADLRVTEESLDAYWRWHVIPGAVDYLIGTTCFGWKPGAGKEWLDELAVLMDQVRNDPADADAYNALARQCHPDHQACLKLWHNDGDSGFYCLGPINRCVNCGAEWIGITNVSWKTGQLLKGCCPKCQEPFEGLYGQRAIWREMIAETIADQLRELKKNTQAVTTGMIFRLAKLHIDAGLVQLGSTAESYAAAQHKIKETLRSKGLDGSDMHDAVNWAVYSGVGVPAIGMTLAETQGMKNSDKRAAVPAVMRAAIRTLNGGTVDKAAIAKIQKTQGRDWGLIGQIVGRVPIEKVTRAYNRHPRVDATIINDPERPGMSFLLLAGTDEDMILVRQDISSSIMVNGEVEAEVPDEWLEVEEAE